MSSIHTAAHIALAVFALNKCFKRQSMQYHVRDVNVVTNIPYSYIYMYIYLIFLVSKVVVQIFIENKMLFQKLFFIFAYQNHENKV